MTLTPDEMEELKFLLIMVKMKQNADTLRLKNKTSLQVN